jgi:hypothetical protein
MGMLLLMLLLNFVVSWANCWSVGRAWNEAKALGGWGRLLTWCGAVQAAVGFSSVIGFLFGTVLHLAGKLPPTVAQGAVSLWYLFIIVPALSTGLVILVESWRVAIRERSWSSTAAAGYNTIAMGHNLYGASDGIGQALANVGKLFSGKDEDSDNMAVLALGLAVAALLGGVILTAVLVRHYASRERLPAFARA